MNPGRNEYLAQLFRKLVVVPLWVMLIMALPANAEEYCISDKPDWVTDIQIDPNHLADRETGSGGVSYPLLDYQTRSIGQEKARYRHIAAKALNVSGVEEISRLSIDFDPAYEVLCIHSMVVKRNGKSFDRIKKSKISVIQQERELAYQIYDGVRTFNAFMEDVQVGDTVEYSYTIEGINPILKDIFATYIPMQWGVPVGLMYSRLLWPENTPLYFRNHNTDVKPITATHDGVVEYVWQAQDVPAKNMDENIPSWYDAMPGVYISNMNEWQQVVKWALPLYEADSLSPKLQELVEQFKLAGNSDEERAMAALAFVQNNIRYLGIEMGSRSHKPGSPDDVVSQGYGDCKDKSRLLVRLLNALHIEAFPALVHNNSGKLLLEGLPTPVAFNHVIVHVRIGGKRYWLDPSLTYQAKSLRALYTPHYDYALVVAPDTNELVHMADDIQKLHAKLVYEKIDLSKNNPGPADYSISSVYGGYFADNMRKEFSEISIDKIENNYLNYLSQSYPEISNSSKIKIMDDVLNNKFETAESYAIKNIWEETEDGRYIQVNLKPFLIRDNIKRVTSPVRTMPYSVNHPVAYTHHTTIALPPKSQFEDEFSTVEDPAFVFSRSVKVGKGELQIDYNYKSLRDYVLPEDIGSHAENIDKVLSLASYSIQKPSPSIGFGKDYPVSSDVNWPMIFISLSIFGVSFFVFWKYLYLYDPAGLSGYVADPALQGIRGWLALHALGIVMCPLILLAAARNYVIVFSNIQLSIVKDSYPDGWFVNAVFMEWFILVPLFVFSLFLVVIFFQKRNTYPVFYIIFQAAIVLYSLIDMVGLQLLFPDEMGALAQKDVNEFLRLFLVSLCWCVYMLKSKRVKSTFTRRRH